MKKTIGYAVIDTITGDMLGVWHSVSERGAKAQAAKARNTEFRYLTATPYVEETPVVLAVEGSKGATPGYIVTDRNGNTVYAGDTITDFRGDLAVFESVSRGTEYNGTAKVIVSHDTLSDGVAVREYYATVFGLTVTTEGPVTDEFGSVDTQPEPEQAAEYRATFDVSRETLTQWDVENTETAQVFGPISAHNAFDAVSIVARDTNRPASEFVAVPWLSMHAEYKVGAFDDVDF